MKTGYPIPINYAGYIPLARSILHLVRNNILNFSELGFLICFVMQADFDSKHRNYSIIQRDDKQLATEFGINSTTFYRHRSNLIKIGLLTEENGVIKVTNFPMFELDWVRKLIKLPPHIQANLFLEKDQTLFQQTIANLQRQLDSDDSNDLTFSFSIKGNKSKGSI